MSALAVTLAEMGDKTQLLALLLAARFKRPMPIILGILCATLANHAAAGLLGVWIRSALTPQTLRWLVAVAFFVVAAWTLVPDKVDESREEHSRYGVFVITLVAFFLAEIGDKTQIATVILATKYDSLPAVVGGTTLGMLIADVPAVFIGSAAAVRLPLRLIRIAAACLFAILGLGVLLGWGL